MRYYSVNAQRNNREKEFYSSRNFNPLCVICIEAQFQHLSRVNCGSRHAAHCMGLLQSHNHIGPMAALARRVQMPCNYIDSTTNYTTRVQATTAGYLLTKHSQTMTEESDDDDREFWRRMHVNVPS